MNNRILITGGCGFIGSNLTARLLASGYEVVIYDNLSTGRIEHLNGIEEYQLIEGDIRDQARLEAALAGVGSVIHLAAFGSVVASVADPAENFSVNAAGTFTLLQAARRCGIDHLIFASTGGALMGNTPPPVDERSLPQPISPYGASKLAGEGYCCAFANAYSMPVTALRFANVIGPVSWHKRGAVTTFFKAILNGESIPLHGDGLASRDFLYVGDLCDGIISALSRGDGFRVYHLASGREVTILQLIDMIRTVAGVPDHPVELYPARAGEVTRNFANSDLARRELGFVPGVTIEQALEHCWEWFRNHDPLSA